MTMKNIVHEGVEYHTGTAGSLIIACEICGQEHFRSAFDYFWHPEWHKCFACPDSQMVPIKVADLETKWWPFWQSLGFTLTGNAAEWAKKQGVSGT